METDIHEPTRLALASAILKGSLHRQRILKKLEYPYRAVAPEWGLDVSRLRTVCAKMESREIGYRFFAICAFTVTLIAVIGEAVVWAMLALAVTIPVFAYKRYKERFVLIRPFEMKNFSEEALDRAYPSFPSPTHDDVTSDHLNVIVYRDFLPFDFAGTVTSRVAFTVDLSRGEDGQVPKPLRTGELYEAVYHAVADPRIEGVVQKDCLFISGEDVTGMPEILANRYSRPAHYIDEAQIRTWEGKNDTRGRHYRWIEVASWGGDLVVSYFLRFAIKGDALYCEIAQCVLTPPSDAYRVIDRQPKLVGFREVVSWWLLNIAAAPFRALLSAVVGYLKVAEGIGTVLSGGEDRQRRKEIDRNPRYNYGAEPSVRVEMASGAYIHYFQRMDGEFEEKTLERRILDATIDVLADHNIDVSALKESRTTIVNSGVLVQGGDVSAQSLAVGDSAKATTIKNQAKAFTHKVRQAGKKAA